jgi:hypothetical protein
MRLFEIPSLGRWALEVETLTTSEMYKYARTLGGYGAGNLFYFNDPLSRTMFALRWA